MTIDRKKFIDFISQLPDEQWENFCKAYGFAGSAGGPAEDELMGSTVQPNPSTKTPFKVAADSAGGTRGFRRRWGSRVAEMPTTEDTHGSK